MVGMMMRAEDVSHRLAGHALDVRQDLIVVLLELVVHQDDPFTRHVNRDIAAIAADNLVQIVLDLVDCQFRRRIRSLGVSDPGSQEEKHPSAKAYEFCPAHLENYISLGASQTSPVGGRPDRAGDSAP